jgi:hypothetical protein
LIIAACLLEIILLASPLIVLTPKLAKTKHRDAYAYGALGTTYSRAFDAKWIEGSYPEREELLGTADIQSLADLSNSFSVIREMKVILVDKRILIGLAVPAVLPMIPLVLIATPADEIVHAVFKLLL